jgi:hypothetical protein
LLLNEVSVEGVLPPVSFEPGLFSVGVLPPVLFEPVLLSVAGAVLAGDQVDAQIEGTEGRDSAILSTCGEGGECIKKAV